MDNLYNLVDNVENLNETSRIRLPMDGYAFLKKSMKYRFMKPALRKYLFSRALSRFMEIPPTEWDIALFLPLERFEGDTRRKIFIDTRKKYRKGLNNAL